MPDGGSRVALHNNDNPCAVHSVSCFQGIRPLAKVTGRQGRRLSVASGATAPGPALEGAPRFRPISLSSYILR